MDGTTIAKAGRSDHALVGNGPQTSGVGLQNGDFKSRLSDAQLKSEV